MTLLEIILIGYIINVICYALIVIISLIITVMHIIIDDVNTYKETMYLVAAKEDIDRKRSNLKKKKISTITQYDLIFLIPFSAIINLLMFLWFLGIGNMNGYYYYILNVIDKELDKKSYK